MEWSVETARHFANQGRLEEWLHSYLRAGNWVNSGLSNGLKQAQRWWIGPVLVPIEQMVRNCGPEPVMPFKVTVEDWEQKTHAMASSFDDPVNLPPVILQSIFGTLYLRDGNHRSEAARKKGWQSLWAIIWFDSEEDWKTNNVQHIHI